MAVGRFNVCDCIGIALPLIIMVCENSHFYIKRETINVELTPEH